MAEYILRPPETRNEKLWRIEETQTRLIVLTPMKDEKVINMLKRLSFSWASNGWTRARPETDDLLIEVAVSFLSMGLIVSIPRDEIIPRIIAGKYAPYITKRVYADDERRNFYFDWAWGDGDFYGEIRKIHGSWWDRGKKRVVVPKEQYNEVLDFAEKHSFMISDSAMAMIEETRSALRDALIVNVGAPHKPLEISTGGSVYDELRDYD